MSLFLSQILPLFHPLAATLGASWRRVRAHRARLAAQAEITEAVLRDLAIDRSELSSIEAEADGRAPQTRRRLVAACEMSRKPPCDAVRDTKSYQRAAASNVASNGRCLTSGSLSTFTTKEL